MNVQEKILVGEAVDFYGVIQRRVYSVGRKILGVTIPEGSFPEEDGWRFKDGEFRVTFGTSWGRRCSCCEPERKTIRFPWALLWSEEELQKYLESLSPDEDFG